MYYFNRTLNFNNQPLLIGGLSNADPVLERPGQVHSDDLVGCVHSVSINGRALNLSSPIKSSGIVPTCSRRGSCSKPSQDPCGETGSCLDRWSTVHCKCGSSLIAPNCHNALLPVSISDGGFVEYKISEKHRRMQLLDSLYGGNQWQYRKKRAVSTPAHISTPPKSISLLFKTVKQTGVLFYAASNKHYTSVELIDGQVMYISRLASVVNMTGQHPTVTDGKWHNLTLHSHSRGLQLLLDGARLGEELDSAGVHDFLDPYLTSMFLGGAKRNSYYAHDNKLPQMFEGCLTNFSINNEIQPFNGSGSIFGDVILHGKVTKDCHGPIGVGTAAVPDPLSIGITLVIVFFVVLLVAILVSFVVFRLRKQKKEKNGSPGNSSNIHTKQNGGSTLISSSGLVTSSNDNVISRQLHSGDTSMGYHSENGDVIRGVAGHHLVAPELISKKFKEREISSNEHQRHQRPDIIEREVVSKSPPIREDHHPPLPPSSNHTHDHAPTDINSELPEHYDLENASSIAPSDIDIVYHYKGYREAGGVRKYKATPPPVASYHHKHSAAQGQVQHRHSPHHQAFPPRAPPVSSTASTRPHQSTPLARLSPSSELSAQQPRILTLHDISGKPLQSALLATTSSSGGVGKDALHSNSERSLNSPVMSQLSGQSSSSRKAGVPPPVTNSNSSGMGLTAEEIERLNSRPRTSSLVSTLDAVSSSSEAPARGNGSGHLTHLHHSPAPDTHRSSTSTDESGNDSFTCSEIEYDNASLTGDKYKPNSTDNRRADAGVPSNKPMPPPSYDGFDSSFRGSLSTLVASDDDLGGPLYRPPTGSPSSTSALGWDYLLNWGPNFESLVGVFKDIAELPDSVNGRVPSSLRLPNAPKPSEEYV